LNKNVKYGNWIIIVVSMFILLVIGASLYIGIKNMEVLETSSAIETNDNSVTLREENESQDEWRKRN